MFLDIAAEDGWTTHHENQDGVTGPPGHSMVSRLVTDPGIVSHRWTHAQPSRGAAAVSATFRGY